MGASLGSIVKKYQARGFFPVDTLIPGDLVHAYAGAVAIVKGDLCLFSSGYAINSAADITSAIAGVAAASVDNSAGAAGDKIVPIIKPRSTLRFIVPVEAVLITQAAVGNIYDLGTYVYSILISDSTISSGPGFKVDAIDVSDDAIDGNTYGYAIGHFEFAS